VRRPTQLRPSSIPGKSERGGERGWWEPLCQSCTGGLRVSGFSEPERLTSFS